MYELTVTRTFNAAHNLRNYKGKCESVHGHNWKVDVTLRGVELDKSGMVLDFKEIKKATEKVLSKLDHKHLNKIVPFNRISPSSENIARYIYEKLASQQVFLRKKVLGKYWLYRVMVWETETSRVAYTGE
ncbi:MAG: 6-carboxytetrahydropterin synthase QueD [bacterium]